MVSASKAARKRHKELRQQAQMENLAKGAAEQPPPVVGEETVIRSADGKFEQKIRVVPRGTNPASSAPAPGAPMTSSGAPGAPIRQEVGIGASSRGSSQSSRGGPIRQQVRTASTAPGVSTPQGQTRGGASIVIRQGGSPNTGATTVRQGAAPVQGQAAPAPMPNTQPPRAQLQAQTPQVDVTVYLTCFERPALFRRQLQMLQAQTVQPAHIFTLVNRGEVPQDEPALSAATVTMLRANANMGPWFRFTVAQEAPTKYVCILDDDTLLGPRWLEAAIARLEEEDGEEYCVAVAGKVFRTDSSEATYGVGAISPREEEMEVDVGQQGWLLRTEQLVEFAQLPRQGDGRTGCGFHLAAAMQLNNLVTIVLPYDPNNREAWGMLESPVKDRSLTSAIDHAATQGLGPTAAATEAALYAAYRDLGWKPLVVLDAEDDAEEAAEEVTPE
jgi:hypothetical protein